MKSSLLPLLLAIVLSGEALAGSDPVAATTVPQVEVRRALVYDFVEGGYTQISHPGSFDLYGGYLSGSISPINNVFLYGRVAGYGGSDNALDVSVGAGLYIPLTNPNSTPTIDLTLAVGYGYFGLDRENSSTNSLLITPGFRAKFCHCFEWNGQVLYYHNSDTDAVALGTGVVYYLSDHFGIAANYSYDLDDDSHFFQVGARSIW
ncbi:MAG: hypothetical protein KDK99_09160 [Verrucomicrobiales bacterium]|nr:hypothetical protein [Verrucomicrobiales bacterium]